MLCPCSAICLPDVLAHLAPLTLLTVALLTLTFPFALITYLFVAHTLGAPDSALSASLLAGAVTALVGLFCIGLVKDTWVDPAILYRSYSLDILEPIRYTFATVSIRT